MEESEPPKMVKKRLSIFAGSIGTAIKNKMAKIGMSRGLRMIIITKTPTANAIHAPREYVMSIVPTPRTKASQNAAFFLFPGVYSAQPSISGVKNTRTLAQAFGLSKNEYTRPGIFAFTERSVNDELAGMPITKR